MKINQPSLDLLTRGDAKTRITLRLPSALHAKLTHFALANRLSLNTAISLLLDHALTNNQEAQK